MTAFGVFSKILEQDTAQPLVRLLVVNTEGSVPREQGAAMLVGQDGVTGTIGGGRLEYEAIVHARHLLTQAKTQPSDWLRDTHTWPLGPALGQCCGGAVRLLFEHYGRKELEHTSALAIEVGTNDGARSVLIHPMHSGEPLSISAKPLDTRALPLGVMRAVADIQSGSRPIEPVLLHSVDNGAAYFVEPTALHDIPLFVYGAGHVGQAIVKIASDLEFDIHWVDTHADRFPEEPPSTVRCVVARDPAIIADAAPRGAFHVVLTYSHAMDLAICHALLAKPSHGFLGLIGSKTKRARFHKRLCDGGVSPSALDGLICPIGIGGLRGKEPATIAVSIVAQVIERLEVLRATDRQTAEGTHGTSQRISA